MGQIDLPELTRIEEKIDSLTIRVENIAHRILPEWIDLETACKLKGINKKTVQNNPRLQPDLSKRERAGHRDVWHKSVIIDWLPKTDKELEGVTKTVTTKQGNVGNHKESISA